MISFHWHVPAGDRDCGGSKTWKAYRNNKNIPMGLVRVRFNHALDEMFYFEDEKDAEWFVAEGFKYMLSLEDFLDGEVVSVGVVETDVVETDVVAPFKADNFDHIKF